MEVLWGLVILALGVLAWGGQAISWLVPSTAARLGLAESQETVDDVYWADIRGEALWDTLTLWTLLRWQSTTEWTEYAQVAAPSARAAWSRAVFRARRAAPSGTTSGA